jgi:hypothetical protein
MPSLQGVKDPRGSVGFCMPCARVGFGVASHPSGARPSKCIVMPLVYSLDELPLGSVYPNNSEQETGDDWS